NISQERKIIKPKTERKNLASVIIGENPQEVKERVRQSVKNKYGCYLFGRQLDEICRKARNDPRYNSEKFVYSFVVPENFLTEMKIYMEIVKKDFKLKVYQKYNSRNILLLEDYVGIGKNETGGFSTHPGEYYLQRIIYRPYWYPPKWSNQKKPFKPGRNNPFGLWMSELSEKKSKGSYSWSVEKDSGMRIHSTNNPESVGKKSSHGCIRMNPKTAENLFRGILYNSKIKSGKTNSRGTIFPLENPIKIEISENY
ncbi:MAG: L,D-transpeptidase, partial [Minisyncoccales bacterium]